MSQQGRCGPPVHLLANTAHKLPFASRLKLRLSIQYVTRDVSEKHDASNFYPEDGGRIFLHTDIYNKSLKADILSPFR
jgi:hypothetical protein